MFVANNPPYVFNNAFLKQNKENKMTAAETHLEDDMKERFCCIFYTDLSLVHYFTMHRAVYSYVPHLGQTPLILGVSIKNSV